MQVLTGCKNRRTSPKNPKGAKWCFFCKHYSLTDIDNFCDCCGNTIPKTYRHSNILKILNKIIKHNSNLIDEYSSFPINDDLSPGWHIRINGRTHWIPIRWLVKYNEISHQDTDNQFFAQKYVSSNPDDFDSNVDNFIKGLIQETRLEMPSCVIVK